MIIIDLLKETEDGLVHSEKLFCEDDPDDKKRRPKEVKDLPRPALQIVPVEPTKG